MKNNNKQQQDDEREKGEDNENDNNIQYINDKHPFNIIDSIGNKSIPVNGNIKNVIESDYFIGDVMIRIAGLHDSDSDYFNGRKRRSQTVIQGRFKHKIFVSKVMSGYRFNKPFVNIPHAWLFEKALGIVKYISPLLFTEPFIDTPYFFAPLIHVAQTIRIDLPGNAPSILTEEAVVEETRLFGGTFNDDNNFQSPSYRRNFISGNPDEMDKMVFDTKYVYTFQFYEHMLDLASFSVDFGFGIRAYLSTYLQGQPIHILVTIITDESKSDEKDNNSISKSSNPKLKYNDLWKLDIIHELNKPS